MRNDSLDHTFTSISSCAVQPLPKLATKSFLLPTENTDLRRSLDHWFEAEKLHPLVVGEFEDSALLQVFGQSGMGLFAGPSAIESEIKRQYGVQVVGRIEAIRERFYAISVERKLKHPAVLAISDAARQKLFE